MEGIDKEYDVIINARMWMDANPEKWGRDDEDHFVCLVDENEVPDYVLAHMKKLNDDMDDFNNELELVEKMFGQGNMK